MKGIVLSRPVRIAAIALVAVMCLIAAVLATYSPAEQLLRSAERDGHVVIYSATDRLEAAEMIAAFRRAHPSIEVDYRSLSARSVYDVFRREADAGDVRADLLVNSAMDLQIKLVNDGYAQRYASPERGALPAWASWKEEAYAVSAEPIVIGYNPRLLPAALVPRSHDDLAALLHRQGEALSRRIGTYDPAASPTGYLYLSQDVQADRDSWDLISAIGRAQPRLYSSSKDMIEDVSAGRLTLAYNLIGSYAFERAARDPSFRVVVPEDFALMMSRVALIPKGAPHPAAARLFLNFMMSREGQGILARHHMVPVRTDMPVSDMDGTATNIRAVRVGPALMAGIDAMTFARFTRRWRETLAFDERGTRRGL